MARGKALSRAAADHIELFSKGHRTWDLVHHNGDDAAPDQCDWWDDVDTSGLADPEAVSAIKP